MFQIKQKIVICTHLKVWVAVARHNFKWVNNRAWRVKGYYRGVVYNPVLELKLYFHHWSNQIIFILEYYNNTTKQTVRCMELQHAYCCCGFWSAGFAFPAFQIFWTRPESYLHCDILIYWTWFAYCTWYIQSKNQKSKSKSSKHSLAK